MPTNLLFSAAKYLANMENFHKKLGPIATKILKDWAVKMDGKTILVVDKCRYFCGKYRVSPDWLVAASEWVKYEELS